MAAAGKPGARDAAIRGGRQCPICGKDAVDEFSPFCSKRCVDVDLHRWLSGAYSIPAVETDEISAEKESDGDADR